ncbi:hypothetical protein [Streptomyces glebosus]|nr:hypothetical protein [Streptomyces glebosus]
MPSVAQQANVEVDHRVHGGPRKGIRAAHDGRGRRAGFPGCCLTSADLYA